MLRQICEYNNFPHINLKGYCSDRDGYKKMICDNYGCDDETSKNLFIILLYGGGFKKWIQKNNITPEMIKDKSLISDNNEIYELDSIINFRKEMACINRRVELSNPNMKTIVIANKLEQGQPEGTYNLGGTMTSFMLQEYEIRVLEQVYKHCLNSGLIEKDECVLCADGLMIDKKHYKPELLNTLSAIVSTELGFKLKLAQKEMDMDYLKILDKNQIADTLLYAESDDQARDIICCEIKDILIPYKGQWFFKHNHIWINEFDFRHLSSIGI